MQRVVHLIEHLMILFIQLVLFLIGHMSHRIVLLHQGLNLCLCIVSGLVYQSFKLCNNVAFLV